MDSPTLDDMLQEWRRIFPDAAQPAVFDELVAAYSLPNRHYHNLRHIWDCLALARGCEAELQHPRDVEIAIWFHDAVYDPTRKDNEAQSAKAATICLGRLDQSSSTIQHVRELILDTRHTATPSSLDGAYMIDIDLSILGREPEVFDAYDRAIRLEYAHVPDEQYRAGRTAVLLSFLDRPTIFYTPRFAERYEQPARRNLERAIAKLASPRPKPADLR